MLSVVLSERVQGGEPDVKEVKVLACRSPCWGSQLPITVWWAAPGVAKGAREARACPVRGRLLAPKPGTPQPDKTTGCRPAPRPTRWKPVARIEQSGGAVQLKPSSGREQGKPWWLRFACPRRRGSSATLARSRQIARSGEAGGAAFLQDAYWTVAPEWHVLS